MEEFNSQKFILNSVNILLQSIGELPIESVEDIDAIIEARIARDAIIESKMFVLSSGWNINTDSDYELHTDENGYINVPVNALDVRIDGNPNIIVRDGLLYDKSTKTRKFTDSVSARIIWNLDFNTLPHPFRHYITVLASRIFQGRLMSDKTVYSFSQEDEQKALLLLRRSEGFTGQYNMLNSTFGRTLNILG